MTITIATETTVGTPVGAAHIHNSPERWELIPDELTEKPVNRLVARGAEVQAV